MEVSATSLRIHPRENNIHADTSWTLHLGVLPSLCEGGLISTDVTSRYVCANVGVELKWGIHSHYHGVSQAPVSVGPPCNPNLKHVFSYCLGTKIDPVCVCACVCVGGLQTDLIRPLLQLVCCLHSKTSSCRSGISLKRHLRAYWWV